MSVRYVIICQARTGSTMLSTALATHPEICAHGEVLNLRTDDRLEFVGLDYHSPAGIHDLLRAERFRNPAHFIDRYVFHAGARRAVGFKFKYEEMSHPAFQSAREYILRNRDIRIVHVYRKNLWKRYLSEYLAINVTRQFNSTGKAIEVPDVRIRMDPLEIQQAIEKSRKWKNGSINAFHVHDSIMISYEELIADPATIYGNVTDFLGVSRQDFNPQTKKIVQKDPRGVIENYDEIVAFFRNTEMSAYFD